ncbi:hypothetical protein E2C01_002876 [Portunus trituberculatus]|uniref:Uncharacterized protein n=1 Tax=Portunus trituberculatus TaxID=210409 RepID=A0A5B7CNP0_PORTR|nr:hypothetical protein [Portunus trituberculatus]
MVRSFQANLFTMGRTTFAAADCLPVSPEDPDLIKGWTRLGQRQDNQPEATGRRGSSWRASFFFKRGKETVPLRNRVRVDGAGAEEKRRKTSSFTGVIL